MNCVILVARLVKDVELKNINSRDMANFSVAVNRDYKNADGTRDADFFNVTAFNNLAIFVSRYGRKGDKICLKGRLQTRNYTDTNGSTHYVTEILADSVEFLENKQENQQPQDMADTRQKPKQQEQPQQPNVEFDDDIPF